MVEGDEAPVGSTFLDAEVPAEHPDGLHTLTNPARKVLVYPLKPIPRLLVLGAGVDAVPLVEFAERLGWRVTVCDHRRSYLERGDFGAAEAVAELRPENLAGHIDLDCWDACVVMSHHLASDRFLPCRPWRTGRFRGSACWVPEPAASGFCGNWEKAPATSRAGCAARSAWTSAPTTPPPSRYRSWPNSQTTTPAAPPADCSRRTYLRALSWSRCSRARCW